MSDRPDHDGAAAAHWSIVWQDEFIGITNVTFGAQSRSASITWQDAIGVTVPDELFVSSVTFAHGGRAAQKALKAVK